MTKAYEIGKTTVSGRSYDTLDGEIVVFTDALEPYADALPVGAAWMVTLAMDAYSLISYQTNAEMFTNFQLNTNTREFLTEIRAGGDLTKLKSATIITR